MCPAGVGAQKLHQECPPVRAVPEGILSAADNPLPGPPEGCHRQRGADQAPPAGAVLHVPRRLHPPRSVSAMFLMHD